jgi:hypothetical protein
MSLHRHLWADYLENVGAPTSHNLMGLHGLLQGTGKALPIWKRHLETKSSAEDNIKVPSIWIGMMWFKVASSGGDA